jgi:hypothetical protein
VIRGTLATDTNILSARFAGLDAFVEQCLTGGMHASSKRWAMDTRVAVQAEGKLGESFDPIEKTIVNVAELISHYCI